MTQPDHPHLYEYQTGERDPGRLNLRIRTPMNAVTAGPMIRDFDKLLSQCRPATVTIDLQNVDYIDDFGVLVLWELKNAMLRLEGEFQLRNVQQKVRDFLDLTNFDAMGERVYLPRKRQPNVFIRLGGATLRLAADLKFMISFIGSVVLAFVHVCFRPKTLRVEDTLSQMQKAGVDALPIVGLISLLLGLIIAFMSSIQLRQFGADIYVASLVGLAMTRELGPIMTAIIVAGRSGSAFAAEIGTMKISEEIDALYVMGFDPTRFLAVPRILASVIVVPLLTLFSDLFGIAGGLLVSISMLNLTVGAYVNQTLKTLELFDVFWGFGKSAVFALLIAWVSCLRGFQAEGGAASVGRATTSAVVSSIFLIVLTNSVFSVILSYW